MSGFWDQDEKSEWEGLEETLDDQAQAVLDEFEDEYEEDEYEEYEEETMEDYQPSKGKAAYSLNKREASVLSDATVRLEQARLYDMLIKHDLFAGVKANPKALANVQRELKDYIVSRLEVLLGIREDETKKKEEPKQIIVESPFNDVEIDFLKALSYKGTKGASAHAKPKTLAANEISPLRESSDAPQGLRSLAQPEPEVEEEYGGEPEPAPPLPAKRKPARKAPAKKPAAKKPTRKAPIKKTPSKSIKRKRRGQMSDAEAEAIAREELKQGTGLSKHPYEMTAKELKELAKRSSKKTVQPTGALPPATSAQTEQLIYQQQLQQQSRPDANGVNLLVQKLIHDKNNK